MATETEARAREVLSYLSPNCDRETWAEKICPALKAGCGEPGAALWHEWSSRGDSYSFSEAEAVWRSWSEFGKITFATLVDLAKREGYDPRGKFVPPTAEQVATREARCAEMQKVLDENKAAKHALARETAQRLWDAALEATDDHPYLHLKGVKAHLLRLGTWARKDPVTGEKSKLHNVLYLPLKNADNEIQSLQVITADGDKIYLSGGAKMGNFFPIGKPTVGAAGQRVFGFAEGYATAASAHELTGIAVLCSFDVGNMARLVRRMRERRPDAELIIFADNDTDTEAKGYGNPGMKAAFKVGMECNAAVVINRHGGDFNDLVKEHGAEAAQDAFDARAVPTAAYEPPKPPAAPLHVDAAAGQTDAAPATLVPDLEEYPCWRVFDEPVFHEGKEYHGLFYFGMKDGGKSADAEPKPFHIYVSGPLHIVAQTHAASEKHSYGRLLRWKTSTGKWQEWAMPAEMLAGDAKEARAALLSQGLEISPDAHQYLKRWLARGADRLDSVHCVQQTGWTSDAHDAFVLPSRAIGPKAAKAVLQVEQPEVDPYEQHGTLDGWRHTVAGMAPGNSALTVGIAIAFAGPLLDVVGAEPGGLHIWGDSSTGKSTVLAAACSAWGYHKRFGKSWRTTANGLEGAAAHRTDTLLALDEIGQCEPAHLGDSIYLIGNGTGKQRANITGAARAVKNFRVVVLSTGEMSVSAALEKGGVKMRAGQGVRLIDLCGVGRAHGMWDDLHHYASGAAFSDGVKSAAGEHFGHAGPAFIERLARADHGALRARYTELKTKLAGYARGEQAGRVAHRLAAYAMAGELATEFGLTGWAPGWAIDAMVAEFKLWQDGRSTKGQGNAEPHQIMQAIVDFIQKHGDSRFESASGSASERVVLNRAGWWRKAPDEDVQHLFTASALKEATIGFDLDRVLAVLDDVGAIVKQESRAAKGKRGILVKINGKPEFVYAVTSAVLQGKLHPEMA